MAIHSLVETLTGILRLLNLLITNVVIAKRAHGEVEKLLSTDGNIRFIIKEFPILGEDSLKMSKFALAVKISLGDKAYKVVHDILIKMKAAPSTKAFDRIINNLNLDKKLVQDAMESPEVKGIIADTRNLAEKLKISGTPTFVMKDELIRAMSLLTL